MKTTSDHEKLFDEICGKLNELSQQSESTRVELQEKIARFDQVSFGQETDDLHIEMKRLTETLDQERQTSSKLNADLARALELNLKTQLEGRSLKHELELSRAVCQEIRLELTKTLEKFQEELGKKENELLQVNRSLAQLEAHVTQQGDLIKNLSSVAEKKIIELKLALDHKSIEAKDYYSHLQQALTQASVLKQENLALKDFVSRSKSDLMQEHL
jgi:hypothetical protein